MPANRFYYEGPLTQGEIISLADSEHHHLHVVMRGAQGDPVEIINGKGSLAKGEILAIGKKETSLQLHNVTTVSLSRAKFVLAQALLRSQKLDFVLEKGTELGVTEFLFFLTNRSERDKFPKEERLRSLLIAAMKQSGRLFLPKLTFLPSLDAVKKYSPPLYFGDLSPGCKKLADVWEKGDHFLFIAGPEAGFSEEELEELRTFATGVTVSDAVLRAETASLAAIAIAKHLAQKSL